MGEEYRCQQCNQTINNGELVDELKEGGLLHRFSFGGRLVKGYKDCSGEYTRGNIHEKGTIVTYAGVFYEGKVYPDQKAADVLAREDIQLGFIEVGTGMRIKGDITGLKKLLKAK